MQLIVNVFQNVFLQLLFLQYKFYHRHNYVINVLIQVYPIYIYSKSLIHQFKSVTNAINDHESTFNIPSFIHLLLNYIPIIYDVNLSYSISFLYLQIHIKSFPFPYFNYINHLFSITPSCFVN